MRFSIQPEPRPEQRMRTLSVDEVLEVLERHEDEKPALEHYFSPTKKEGFVKEYLHFLNTQLLNARHGEMDLNRYLVFVLSFQFIGPLLQIPVEKELGLFYRIVRKTYKVEEIDLNLHFATEDYIGDLMGEREALEAYRDELGDSYQGSREVRESVQRRLKSDALAAISQWQMDKGLPSLATAFGRSLVLPAFFSFTDRRLAAYYSKTTEGITYRVQVPEEIDAQT